MKTEKANIAQRYAEAVFSLALKAADKHTVQQVLKDLIAVNEVIQGTDELATVLDHPSVAASQKKELILKLFDNKVNELTVRLLTLLSEKRRLELLPYLPAAYMELLYQANNTVKASLVTAEDLSDSAINSIKASVSKQLNKELDFSVTTDKSLLAGAVLKIGDQVIDGSLKGKLQALERNFLLS